MSRTLSFGTVSNGFTFPSADSENRKIRQLRLILKKVICMLSTLLYMQIFELHQ